MFTPAIPDEAEPNFGRAVMEKLQAGPEQYLAAYTRQFGNVLNADDAATLFPEYNQDPAKYRVAVHPAATRIRDELFRRALATEARRGRIASSSRPADMPRVRAPGFR